jgi:aminoglycoside phosphotransferase (APT) family kinase protein
MTADTSAGLPAGITDARLVDSFATGYQRTAVHRSADGSCLWVRSAGADRPVPLTGPGARARLRMAAPRPEGIRVVLPDEIPGALLYTAYGAESAAKLLWTELPPARRDRLTAALHATGRLLRTLHDAPCDAPPAEITGRTGPPGPARLAAWMDTGTGPRAAARLHGVLRARFGPHRWAVVRSWCAELAERAPGDVLLHGAPSTGSVIVADERLEPAEAALLTGEDLAPGPAAFDIGWLLGEFLELRMTDTRKGARPRPLLTDLPAALLDGYGAIGDPPAAGRAAVLRIVTHAHDFAAYMGWHSELGLYADALPAYVDSEGTAALNGTC